MGKLHTFFQANRNLSRRLMNYLPQGPPRAFQIYNEIVLDYLRTIDHPVILDVGGGRECSFSSYKPQGSRLICLDISQEQLDHNTEAEVRLLADATKEIPLPDSSVDLMVSRAVMEHLDSPQAFLRHSYRVLKPGGYGIHVFPCKFAPFAIINGLLPSSFSRKMLFKFQPDMESKGGFPAYYRKCYYTGIIKLFTKTGLFIKDIRFTHSQSVYFDFFLPFFLLVCLYEILSMPFKNLASFIIIVVQKPSNL